MFSLCQEKVSSYRTWCHGAIIKVETTKSNLETPGHLGEAFRMAMNGDVSQLVSDSHNNPVKINTEYTYEFIGFISYREQWRERDDDMQSILTVS